jgi:hypothetical protein
VPGIIYEDGFLGGIHPYILDVIKTTGKVLDGESARRARCPPQTEPRVTYGRGILFTFHDRNILIRHLYGHF